jgi:hypothetical protein
MLSRPRPVLSAVVTAGVSVLLLLPLLGSPALAAPDPGDGSGSAIGQGAISDTGDYIAASNEDPSVDLSSDGVRQNACQRVAGFVTDAEKANYQGGSTAGVSGQWEYRLCAGDEATARRYASDYPDAASARQFCAAPAHQCAVLPYFQPDQPPTENVQIQGRVGFFEGYLRFTPSLGTSPPYQGDDGPIVNFPTWVWDRIANPVQPIYLPIFRGITGIAIRLRSTWRTDGTQFCTGIGTVYDPARHRASDPSPNCGYTYRNQGRYQIRGCKTWLVIAYRPPFFLIVFPLTLCRSFDVNVLETQVVAGR